MAKKNIKISYKLLFIFLVKVGQKKECNMYHIRTRRHVVEPLYIIDKYIFLQLLINN